MVDHEISSEMQAIAEDAGIKIHTCSKVLKIQSSMNGTAVTSYEDKNGEHLLVSDKVLVAIGESLIWKDYPLSSAGVY